MNDRYVFPFKMFSKKIFCILLLITLTSCEDDETNDIAVAQACLDKISSANYASAENCMERIQKYDTAQANILKCSIKFLAGGLTTEKIAHAYQQISSNASAKEATLIATLALSPSSKATEAKPYCEKSGIKGFIYLSNLAVVGSLMVDTLGGIGYDPTDPNNIPDSTDIANIMTNCQPPAACGGNHATIGASVLTLSESYCTGANATTEVCTKIQTAITGAGGDTSLISKQLFCALDNKTYSAGPPEACVP